MKKLTKQSKSEILITGEIPAVFDLWIVGDAFLQNISGTLETLRFSTGKNKNDTVPPFTMEYFNVLEYFKNELPTAGPEKATACILNNLEGAMMSRKHLPKYLLVVIDKDIIQNDVDVRDDDDDTIEVLQELTRYLVRQIDVTLRRCRMNLLEKNPRAVTNLTTKVIYVRMLRRIGNYKTARLRETFELRSKFNDALNDAGAKVDHYILTINSCNAYEHFDKKGELSPKGKSEFWSKIDDLIDRFYADKVKLLPNQKNSPQTANKSNMSKMRAHHAQHQDFRRKLPTPPRQKGKNYY